MESLSRFYKDFRIVVRVLQGFQKVSVGVLELFYRRLRFAAYGLSCCYVQVLSPT